MSILVADRVLSLLVFEQSEQSRDGDQQSATESKGRDLAAGGSGVGGLSADSEQLARLGDGDGGSVADVVEVHDHIICPVCSARATGCIERGVGFLPDQVRTLEVRVRPCGCVLGPRQHLVIGGAS